ncbi:hypothetical protein N7456_001393 [Penicillium angulare]|uniref:Uncharacterized protein n=1 Tax=Penicillium angulare TaxID=116970 RepID=A0A9W9GE93_9EURO|nr:hypothetical protein N7456_001393 [Penicillium angulare]
MHVPVDIERSIGFDHLYTLMSGMVTLSNKTFMLGLAKRAELHNTLQVTSHIPLSKLEMSTIPLDTSLRKAGFSEHHTGSETIDGSFKTRKRMLILEGTWKADHHEGGNIAAD